jgi:coenzyme PQQ precursor peptide PqqA
MFNKGAFAMWTKPEYTEMRFGFEVTMYIANR